LRRTWAGQRFTSRRYFEDATQHLVGRERTQRACHRQLVRSAVAFRRVNSTVICLAVATDMKAILTAVVLNFLVPVVCVAQRSATPSTPPPEIVTTIRRLTRSWDKAMVKRDVAFLDGILADDYVISGLSKPQYLHLIKSSDIKYTSFDRQVLSVRVYGDTVLALGRTNVNVQSSPGGWFSSTFDFMDVWVKQQGRWRCVATSAEEIVQTYQKEEIVHFGPEVKASLVIVFKPDVTNDQVEDFRRNVLQVLSSDEGERNYLSGIREYLRSLPIEKHEAVAITFHKDITIDQRTAIIDRVKSSPLVFKVFEDIAPASVKLNQ
jgi:ketosteroid isomerase-like protein